MRKFSKLLVLFMLMMVTGCSTEAKNLEEASDLTILTVEFNSGAPVPDLYISLLDAETGEEIDSLIGSAEGEATFEGVQEGKDYIISATTLKNSVLGEGFTTVEQVTFDNTQPYFLVQTHSSREYQQLDVPIVMQKPELPHGCEITSLTAVLNYYGVSVTKTEMAENYLKKMAFRTVAGQKIGPNPNNAFAGDPSDLKGGTYVYAAPIVEAAKKAILEKQASLQVTDVSGHSKDEILALVKEGVPVVIWVTLDLTKPRTSGGWRIDGTDDYHKMYQNLHAVVLTGHMLDKVVVMDPLKGYTTYSDSNFFQSYVDLGMQAVAVHK